jgi:hypothetical protein
LQNKFNHKYYIIAIPGVESDTTFLAPGAFHLFPNIEKVLVAAKNNDLRFSWQQLGEHLSRHSNVVCSKTKTTTYSKASEHLDWVFFLHLHSQPNSDFLKYLNVDEKFTI